MSKPKTDKNSFQKLIIPGMVFAAIFIIILASFGVRMISSAKTQVTKDYHYDVNEICQMYNKELYAVDKLCTFISNETNNNGDLFNQKNKDNLATAIQIEGIENIYVISTALTAIDALGNRYESINEVPQVFDMLEFKNKSARFRTNQDGEQKLYICKSIMSDEIVYGYLVVEYSAKMLNTLLDNPKFTARKTFALISSDGDVIENVGKNIKMCEVGSNIIDYAEDFEYIDGSFSLFRQAVADGRTGTQQITYNGEGKYLYYSPIENCKALVIMAVDYADVERSFNEVSKSIRLMLIGIGITIVAFLAVIAGVALFNKAKYNLESAELQNKADTDQLTDLYNKMATERMIREFLTGEGKDSICMLFVLDVDNFKKINDTMGHAFGDKVLAQLGHQIRAWFRVNDIVGRIGGDEFMIFIKDVKNPELVKKEGSRIMQFFETFSVGEYTRYSPTASVGGAVYPTDARDFESLYKAADKAVYKSKKTGKNKVSFYSDLDTVERNIEVSKNED